MSSWLLLSTAAQGKEQSWYRGRGLESRNPTCRIQSLNMSHWMPSTPPGLDCNAHRKHLPGKHRVGTQGFHQLCHRAFQLGGTLAQTE